MTPATFIDYPARVEELCAFAEKEYGVESTPFKILLSTFIPCPPYDPVWLICSSPKGPFWPDFYSVINTLARTGVELIDDLRWIRPRYTRNHIEQWLGQERGRPRVFQEWRWREPQPKISIKSRLPHLLSQCLRIKVLVKTLTPPSDGAREELLRLMRLAINAEHRKTTPKPISNPPEMMEYCLKLTQLLSPDLCDGPELMRNARLLPPSHAVLHGRDRLIDEDWWALYRTLLETIPEWTFKIVKAFADSETALDLPQLMIETGFSREFLVQQCGQLHEAAIIDWPGPNKTRINVGSGARKRWLRLTNPLGEDIRRFVNGDLRWW